MNTRNSRKLVYLQCEESVGQEGLHIFVLAAVAAALCAALPRVITPYYQAWTNDCYINFYFRKYYFT
eukprot:SAG11_NODE_2819_length_2940_cov_31.391059_2_plen_67_part_00